ncbi:nucleoside hydrolase [Aeoliella mucimassa]|uniref:Pyrimidine-specific ribonucleoside hydrolase RihA n=1 Tax=Aeoliella mucimassa TaxID=2527972 RepID=A0A518AML5_9BACT|nr:nucleoside hydrolase [Aeoliella mucimassa]QDU55953.1 Pyrimidine-specific ribonucleoside hydrolase RihA [Aeoliella mucimassa]
MPRKVILDMDPGYSDAVALCVALAAEELDVVAVTATGGNVGPKLTSRNVQAIIEQLDPKRWPRIGGASPDQILRTDARHLHGEDGLCGANFQVAELANRHMSVKVLGDEIRRAPGDITLIATGPMSNVFDLLRYDPDLASQIGHLIMCGGAVAAPGDVTPSAEFNIYCDSEAAKQVFGSPVTKTLIPLDVTRNVMLTFDFLERLKKRDSRTSNLLQRILPGAYRSARQHLGVEGVYVNDAVAVVAAMRPSLFTIERMYGDVETAGTLTHGATVFDRRPNSVEQPNIDVAMEMDAAAVEAVIVQTLESAP